MSNKVFFILLILSFIIIPLNSDIINRTKLLKNKKSFIIYRDLFTPKRTVRDIVNKKRKEKKEAFTIKEEKLKRKHEEIFDNIIYEGFVSRYKNKTALLSINGEFAICREGETILDKIEIIKISKTSLKIKIENKQYDIDLKENEDEEK